MSLKADDIDEYIEDLLAGKILHKGKRKKPNLKCRAYSVASVNRHTQLLQQAFNLAIEKRKLNEKPGFKHLSEKGNTRIGFVSEAEARRIASHLPAHLADLTLFAFYSAWRRNEILTLTWDDVQGDTIRLRAENSKEGEARSLALEGELATIIECRRKLANGPLVFHSGQGSAVVDFRKSWKTATRMAGCSGRIFHDLRRSGVRDMIRSGTAPHVAISISGHKSDSMLTRYAIISEADQRVALRRTQEFRQAEAAEQASTLLHSTQVQ